MSDASLVVGLAGVVSGAVVTAAAGYWQTRVAKAQQAAETARALAAQRAETARAAWAQDERHLDRRLEAYAALIAFLIRPDYTMEGRPVPVIRAEEKDQLMLTFSNVMLLGTPEVRRAAQEVRGLVRTEEPTGQTLPRESVAALLHLMREDVARAEVRRGVALQDIWNEGLETPSSSD